MRIGRYLRTMGRMTTQEGKSENVEVALDTCAEIDTIDSDFAQ